MREIKFRVWDEEFNMMHYNEATYHWNLGDLAEGRPLDWKWMQFTGLVDKLGKEIYEGDIVKYNVWKSGREDGWKIGQIVWSEDECAFRIKEASYQMNPGKYTPHLEVIGQVYSNPELLR